MGEAFYSRCKPQDADALKIALDTKRIFIGYPMVKKGKIYSPQNLHSCIVDPACGDTEWSHWHNLSNRNRQYNRNRNFVNKIKIGSVAMIPRPSLGVIFCGRVKSPFQLENNPAWYSDYLELRRSQKLSNDDPSHENGEGPWHAADVAQCWEVDEFRPIPIPRIPAWIRRSMFGRSTYGTIPYQQEIKSDPYSVLSDIMDNPGFEARGWTTNEDEVKRRLVTDLTPSSFEHLAVSLLQLEYPDEVWTQVGGSGDGGIDGIGADNSGKVTGLLQCKWQYWGGEVFSGDSPWGVAHDARKYLAALMYPPDVASPQNCEFLNRDELVRLVIKHHEKLPLARSMRVGKA
jgi:hypothetical protein